MHSQLITIEPEVIQFGRDTSQTIKIINQSSLRLKDFFFCLYNVEKFQFKPETFSLEPHEHKLIEVTLKIKSIKSIAKEFAYLKSSDVNKRITMLINNFQSPESRTRQTQEALYSDMNTLSSRDYHEMHNRALHKIIAQQEGSRGFGMQALSSNKKSVGGNGGGDGGYLSREFSYNKTETNNRFSDEKIAVGSSHMKTSQRDMDFIREVEARNLVLERDLQEVTNVLTRQNKDVERLEEQNRFLEEQGSKFLKKISEKEQRVKQLEQLYERVLIQNEQSRVKLRELQTSSYHNNSSKNTSQQYQSQKYKQYESRIKQLQNAVLSSQREQAQKFNKQFQEQIKQKDLQLEQIRNSLQHHELLVKQHQIKVMKLQNRTHELQETKRQLEESKQSIVEENNNLKEEIFVYKSRVEEVNQGSKVQEYLGIALDNYKNENQSLKKSKTELQKSLDSIIQANKENENSKKSLQEQIFSLQSNLSQLQIECQKQESIKQAMRQQHHYHILEIKNEHVSILEKINEDYNTKREEETDRLKHELFLKEKQIDNLKDEINQSTDRLRQRVSALEGENEKLQEKVKRYKKEARKQLKSINDNAFDELKRIHDEKKELGRKVTRLEKTIYELESRCGNGGRSRSKTEDEELLKRGKSKSKGYNQRRDGRDGDDRRRDNERVNGGGRSKSQYEGDAGYQSNNNGVRKIGIHNQKKELQESRANSVSELNFNNNTAGVTVENNYKELVNFLQNEQSRFEYVYSINKQQDNTSNGERVGNRLFLEELQQKPIKRVARFLSMLEQRIKSLQEKCDESVLLDKENQYMKNKIVQLERREENNETQVNNSNPHVLKAVQNINNNNNQNQNEDPSFLNKSYFANNVGVGGGNNLEVLDFMKQEMKKQYNKLKESLRFSDDRYEILKKKVFREYRTRIVELLNSNGSNTNRKDKQLLISKIENTLERFIEGLSNVTHKEAVLNKEIKIKQSLKQENTRLKQKVHQMEHILTEKRHGYCQREPIKVYTCSGVGVVSSTTQQQNQNQQSSLNIGNTNTTMINNSSGNNGQQQNWNFCIKEQEWMESIKLSTQLLTEKAENERLNEELCVIREDCSDLREQLNKLTDLNDSKDGQILQLKRNQVDLQQSYETELRKQNQIIEEMRHKMTSVKSGTKGANNGSKLYKQQKQQEIEQLKEELDRKTTLIKDYKNKEKKWQESLEEFNKQTVRDTQMENSYRRIEESSQKFKENNRELRIQNEELKDQVERLKSELEKKKLHIKNLKGYEDDSRIKPVRVQQTVQHAKSLQEELKSTKQELKKAIKSKERQIRKLQDGIETSRAENLIKVKSLESIIRATIDTMRKIFNALRIQVKKKGLSMPEVDIEERLEFDEFTEINTERIYEDFQKVLQVLEE